MAENENLEKVASAAQEQTAETPAKPEKAEKKGTEKKPAKKSKPGIFARAKQWLKETKDNTLIVIVFCVVIGLCIFFFDTLASALFKALVQLFHG